MRLRHLAVEGFAGIERAEVTFGPRLNIVYAPNDYGKSRLARAIRAALLLPASSAEGRRFVTWNTDRPAHVALSFADREGKHWRIAKSFGVTTPGGGVATLSFSKDGNNFETEVCRGREVDEKIRGLLRWGIPSPGGKASRGLPTSFLTHVLLADQTEVDTLFSRDRSLERDGDDSGQRQLREVLEIAAHDPVLKQVLDTAQAQVDRLFTEPAN